MNWVSASDFFAMGGYGLYVWGSFLVTAVCVGAELVMLRMRHREALQRVRAEKGRHEAAA